MRKSRRVACLLIALMFSFTVTVIIRGSENETVTRQQNFISKNPDEKGKDFDKTIVSGKKKFILKGVKHETVKKTALWKKKTDIITITKETEGSYSPKKKITKNGISYILVKTTNKSKTVNDEKGRVVTGYLSFESIDEAKAAPESHTFTANGATAVCSKQNMVREKTVSWQDSYIDFTFTSTDRDYYEWNGIQIDGTSQNPMKGYDKKILKSIGADSSNYRIGDTYWKSKAHKKNGVYTRVLRVEVRKKVPHYRVNYKGYSKLEKKTVTTYTSRYKGYIKEKVGYEYSITATATYEKVKEKKAVTAPLFVRVGVVTLAVILAGILFIICLKPQKKKKSDVIIRKRQQH